MQRIRTDVRHSDCTSALVFARLCIWRITTVSKRIYAHVSLMSYLNFLPNLLFERYGRYLLIIAYHQYFCVGRYLSMVVYVYNVISKYNILPFKLFRGTVGIWIQFSLVEDVISEDRLQ